jgi:hypothetical protein
MKKIRTRKKRIHRNKLQNLAELYKSIVKRNGGRPGKRWNDRLLDEGRWNRFYIPKIGLSRGEEDDFFFPN